ncbi:MULTISPECIES: hypothetical protein [unclassified Mycobacterium]|uniref:hypothetical protein n=1 Tax=unclassified Mycobacterium TaxID=2642494 RepID=UPI00048DC0DE|nr:MULTISPECIES: hypothetical protein [unclassified Mycobacterium]SEA92343.1 hypothetical protein SAMN04488580_105246 [Mycobacterium sp. 283mftsu]
MGNTIRAVTATAAVLGLVAGCGGKADSGAKGSSSSASTSTSAPAPAELQALVPTPGGTAQTWGPDTIADNGIHLSFKVTGAPTEVVTAYKAALEGKGWAVTTIVSSDGGPGGGGGATYTGTHGDSYAVFDGGGMGTETYLNVCAWPAKPAQPNCSRKR